MSRMNFPYVYVREEHLPRYLRYRCEGHSVLANLLHGYSYYKKYRLKKSSAPEEEVRYFQHQRRLLWFLSNKGPTKNAFAQNFETRLAMVGDLMWLRDGWDNFLAPEVLNYLNQFHIVLGNLETVISPNHKVRSFLPAYLAYNSDPKLVKAFARPDGRSTFTALSVANNHLLDYGDRGALDTLDFLDGQGILYSGVARQTADKPYTTFKANGIKFGFYAATWGMNRARRLARTKLRVNVLKGLAPEVDKTVDISDIRQALVAMAEEDVEFKIVAMHWGYAFETLPDPKLMLIGREIVRHGADLIMGSHPHLQQPVEVCFVNGYEKRYRGLEQFIPAMNLKGGCILNDKTDVPRKAMIAYSLGNFTTAMFTPLCQEGVIQSIKVGRDAKTGHVDWDWPDVQGVRNVPKDPGTGSRRLILRAESVPQE